MRYRIAASGSPASSFSRNLSRKDVATLTALAALFLVLVAVTNFGLYDDAFITFRYAENLFDGCGIRFNCDGERVEGYSNFLWMILLSLSLHLSEDILNNARILGTFFSLVSLALVYLVIRRSRYRNAWLPGLLLATSYYAKVLIHTGPLWTRLIRGLAYTASFMKDNPLILFILLGLAASVVKKETRAHLKGNNVRVLLWLLLSYACFILYVGGDSPGFFYWRFYAHVLPLFFILLAWELDVLGERRLGKAAGVAIVCVLLIVSQVYRDDFTARVEDGRKRIYERTAAELSTSERAGRFFSENLLGHLLHHRHRGCYYTYVGRYIRENTPADYVVSSFSAGELAYFSERRFFDIFGLGSTETSIKVARNPHYNYVANYLEGHPPDLFVLENPPRELHEFFRREGYFLEKVILNREETIPEVYVWPGGNMHLLMFSRREPVQDTDESDAVELHVGDYVYPISRDRIVYFEDLSR